MGFVRGICILLEDSNSSKASHANDIGNTPVSLLLNFTMVMVCVYTERVPRAARHDATCMHLGRPYRAISRGGCLSAACLSTPPFLLE